MYYAEDHWLCIEISIHVFLMPLMRVSLCNDLLLPVESLRTKILQRIYRHPFSVLDGIMMDGQIIRKIQYATRMFQNAVVSYPTKFSRAMIINLRLLHILYIIIQYIKIRLITNVDKKKYYLVELLRVFFFYRTYIFKKTNKSQGIQFMVLQVLQQKMLDWF